jgi:hypothetical protein
MKKSNLVLFFAIIISFLGCEVDDICLEPTTPQLIIRFYDKTNPTVLKKVSSLNIWADGKDSIIKNKATDSIAIPLRTTEDKTIYKFSSSNLVDEISFTYQRSELFISRSCGFKNTFLDLKTSKTTSNWIQQITITNPNLENEKNAHITILH